MKLVEISAIKNFGDAAKDAESRGLVVGKWANKTSVWVKDRSKFFQNLNKEGFETNIADDVIPIKNIADYRKAVIKLEPLTNEEAFRKYILDLLHEKAFNNLQRELANSVGKFPVGSLQLFIPRSNIQNQRNKSWIWGEIEEDAPILVAKVDGEGKYNKPSAALWTSTLKKSYVDAGHTYYTSAWNEWLIDNQPDWSSEWGYVYYVKPEARVLKMSTEHDAENVYKLYSALRNIPVQIDYDNHFGAAESMKMNYPWHEIAKHWDGVHGGYHYNDPFFYGWDCESTAWFDPSVLQLKGKVRVAQKSNKD